jgi:hypothetical protein
LKNPEHVEPLWPVNFNQDSEISFTMTVFCKKPCKAVLSFEESQLIDILRL